MPEGKEVPGDGRFEGCGGGPTQLSSVEVEADMIGGGPNRLETIAGSCGRIPLIAVRNIREIEREIVAARFERLPKYRKPSGLLCSAPLKSANAPEPTFFPSYLMETYDIPTKS